MGIELMALLDNMIHQLELRKKGNPMKKIVRLTVDVLVPENTSIGKSAGLQSHAWEICEAAGRYLRSQLQGQIDPTMDVKIHVKDLEAEE